MSRDVDKKENVLKHKTGIFEEYDFILLFDILEYMRASQGTRKT